MRERGYAWQWQNQQAGVSSNDLTDEQVLDVPSGTHVANGIPVVVESA